MGAKIHFASGVADRTNTFSPHRRPHPKVGGGWHKGREALPVLVVETWGIPPQKMPWTARASGGSPGIRWQKIGRLSEEGSWREKGLPVGEKPEQRP